MSINTLISKYSAIFGHFSRVSSNAGRRFPNRWRSYQRVVEQDIRLDAFQATALIPWSCPQCFEKNENIHDFRNKPQISIYPHLIGQSSTAERNLRIRAMVRDVREV